MSTANPAENSLSPVPEARRGYPFRRLFIGIFMLAMLWLSFWAAVFIGVAQFVLRAFDPDASEDLRSFGGRLGLYMGEVVGYMTFARETAPFPFAAFPRA